MNRWFIAIIAASTLVAAGAEAQSLDPSTGRLDFDPSTVVIDPAAADVAVAVWELGVRPVEDRGVVLEAVDGLSGHEALQLGGSYSPAVIELDPFEEQFEGRRVEFRVWYQPRGTDVDVSVHWPTSSGDLREESVFAVRLLRTGRSTSDGWRELSSGPVDWNFGAFSPLLRIEDGRGRGNAPGLGGSPLFESAPDAHVLIDALSIVDLGEQVVPDVSCRMPDEGTTCGTDSVCLGGRCVDGRVVFGPAPLTPEARQAHVDRRFRFFEIFHAERDRFAKLPELHADFDVAAAGPPGRFYPSVEYAISRQRFGHALRAPLTTIGVSTGLCFVAGIADMLEGAPQRPIVSAIDDQQPAFAELLPGDVLVAIDGIDVDEWLQLAAENPITELHVDPILRQAAAADHAAVRGAMLTFERCPRVDGAACTPAEVETRQIDLVEVFGDAVRRGESGDGVRCDGRFRRPLDVPALGEAIESEVVESFLWLGFDGFTPIDRPTWSAMMSTEIASIADGAIIDTREGGGGHLQLTRVLTTPLVEESVTSSFFMLTPLDVDANGVIERLETCRQAGGVGCEAWGTPQPLRNPGVDATHADVPIVVLLGADASANELFPMALSRRSAPTLFLGLIPTVGALAGFSNAPALAAERRGPGYQLFDSWVAETQTAFVAPIPFTSDYRFPPDEVCMQTQSDAVRGVDTCVEEALQWLRQQ